MVAVLSAPDNATPPALILADKIATMLARFPGYDMILTAESAREALAALRAVEAVTKERDDALLLMASAFEKFGIEKCGGCLTDAEFVRQANLESAVEAVRASKVADEFCFRVCDPEHLLTRGWHTPECRAYREGVEAVQALLEGEK
jgi:hypothetical protein